MREVHKQKNNTTQTINWDNVTTTLGALYNIWNALERLVEVEGRAADALEKVAACNFQNAILTQQRR